MRKIITNFIGTSLLLILMLPSYATYSWLGGSDIWEDPANWDCTCIPGPGDEVVIGSGTVDVADAHIMVSMVTFSGGTIIAGGVGSLTTTTGFGWTGGTIFGKVIIAGSSTMDMSGAATKILKGELHIMPGGLAGWSAGTFHMDGGGFFNSGTFVIESDADITEGVFTGSIENGGTFIKTIGAGTTDVTAFFHNFGAGKIEVESGTLAINKDLFNEATVKVDPGATLDITAGSTFDAGSVLIGPGKIKFSGGTSTYKVAYDGAVEFEFSGGVIMMIEALVKTVGAILIDDAEMTSTGELVAKGTATWEKGDIMHDFTFTTELSALLTISTAGIKKLYGILDLNGPTSWTGGDIDMYGAALIDNAETFTTSFDGKIASATPGGGSITNSGSGIFDKTGGGGKTIIEPAVTNYGSVKATADTLQFEGAFTNHSIAYSSASGNISFFGGTTWLFGSDMTGTGDMDFWDGTNTMSTSISCSNWIGFLGGTSTISATLTNDNKINLESSAVLTGSAPIVSEGDFNFLGGTLDVALTIETASTFDISGSTAKTLTETVSMKGEGTLWSSATDFDLDFPGEIVNTGTFYLVDGADITNSGTPGTFTNSSALIKESSATSSLDVAMSSSGTISGIGVLAPTVSFSNFGVVNPGSSPGILTLDQDFTNGTQINIEILDDSGAGTGHDQLIVTGTVTLEDTLVVVETGTVPDGSYTILTCTGGPNCISGTFEKVTLPANYTIAYNATDVTLIKNGPLPVELIYFKAEVQDHHVLLNWETATEINNEYFQIERSMDGMNFNAIGAVAGAGNTLLNQRYQFIDKDVTKESVLDNFYYRLKQVDLDGAFEYSNIVVVDIVSEPLKSAWSLNVLPLSDGHIQVIYHSTVNHKARLSMYDMSGKVLLQQEVLVTEGAGLIDLFPGQMVSGIYAIQLSAGRFQQCQRFYTAH